MNLTLSYLTHENEDFKKIQSWYQTWWQETGLTNINVYEHLKNSLNNNIIPCTIMVKQNNNLVAVFQVLFHDNDNTNLSPWFANLYVDKIYRGQKIATYILKNINHIMDDLKINVLYLHTKHHNFYEKFGWHYLRNLDANRKIYQYKKGF